MLDDETLKDILAFIVTGIVGFGTVALIQQGEFTVEAFVASITGLALAAALLAGVLGVFFRNWDSP
jgi:1,4-dihydroxy-2-naphthoate octaprenyltransferase